MLFNAEQCSVSYNIAIVKIESLKVLLYMNCSQFCTQDVKHNMSLKLEESRRRQSYFTVLQDVLMFNRQPSLSTATTDSVYTWRVSCLGHFTAHILLSLLFFLMFLKLAACAFTYI